MGTLDRVREESGIADDSMEARKTFFIARLRASTWKKNIKIARELGVVKNVPCSSISFHSISLFHHFFSFRFMSVHPSIPYHSTFHSIAFHLCHSFRSMPFHSMPFCFTHIVSCLCNPFHCMKTHFVVYASSILFHLVSFNLIHLTSFIRSIRFMSFISFHAMPFQSIPSHLLPIISFQPILFHSIHVMSCHVGHACQFIHLIHVIHLIPPASPSHVASCDMISFRLVSFDFMSCQLISFHFISFRFTSLHLISLHPFHAFHFFHLLPIVLFNVNPGFKNP